MEYTFGCGQPGFWRFEAIVRSLLRSSCAQCLQRRRLVWNARHNRRDTICYLRVILVETPLLDSSIGQVYCTVELQSNRAIGQPG